MKEELQMRHTVEVQRQERAVKRQRIEEMAKEEGLTIPKEITEEVSSEETLDKETLRKEMAEENRQYIAKIELGEMIFV